MQRLHNVDKWFEVEPGKAVNFGNPDPRFVRLDVNCAGVAALYYSDGDGETRFLARVSGRDVIEFRSYGEFSITVDGSAVWMYTIDGEDISFSIPDAVKLTKLVERRARNPELELMRHMMNRNLESRLNAMRDEMARILHQSAEAAKPPAEKPKAASDGDGAGKQPAPDKPADPAGGDKPVDGGTGKPA